MILLDGEVREPGGAVPNGHGGKKQLVAEGDNRGHEQGAGGSRPDNMPQPRVVLGVLLQIEGPEFVIALDVQPSLVRHRRNLFSYCGSGNPRSVANNSAA